MRRVTSGSWRFSSAVLLFVLGSTQSAEAYMGPGAGLGAIGTVLAVIGVVLLAVVGFLWYPLKRFLKRKQPEASRPDSKSETDSA